MLKVDVLFGSPSFDDKLNDLLCSGKQLTYIMKKKQSEPSLAGFRNVVLKH